MWRVCFWAGVFGGIPLMLQLAPITLRWKLCGLFIGVAITVDLGEALSQYNCSSSPLFPC